MNNSFNHDSPNNNATNDMNMPMNTHQEQSHLTPQILPTEIQPSVMSETGIQGPEITQAVLMKHAQTGQQIAAMEKQNKGIISGLFLNRGLTKELEASRILLVKDYLAYKRSEFAIATNTKLTLAHEMCLAMTREIKVGNQQRFTALILTQYDLLNQTVNARREQFMNSIDQQYAVVERFLHRPTMIEQRLKSIQREEEAYFCWVDSMLEDFRAISKQRLDEYRTGGTRPNPRPGDSGNPQIW